MCRLQQSVTLLPSTIRSEHYQFIKECSQNIQKAESIDDLFRHLNLYWTYLEYSLLNRIIERHSSVVSMKLQDEMKEYKKDIESFKNRTTIKQLMEASLGVIRMEPPPGFSLIVTKLKGEATEYTLKELDKFRNSICFEYNLPTFILMLGSFQRSSLTINWHIPSSEVYHFVAKSASSTVMKLISEDLFYLKVDMSTKHFGKANVCSMCSNGIYVIVICVTPKGSKIL